MEGHLAFVTCGEQLLDTGVVIRQADCETLQRLIQGTHKK